MTFKDICIIQGKYYLIKYEYIPSEYILKLYYNGNKDIIEFVEQNKDEIFKRAKSTYILPIYDKSNDCIKIAYLNKEIANQQMNIIQSYITNDYKPIRSYYCNNCGMWHLTSKINSTLEKYE